VERKQMDMVGFVRELFGVVEVDQAKEIYRNIGHYPEVKKNIIVDLLRSNPDKYLPVLMRDDE
jgi:hypothetical protein